MRKPVLRMSGSCTIRAALLLTSRANFSQALPPPKRLQAGQAYAWNPSITGCKSEDTDPVGEVSNEIISEITGWPLIKVVIEGKEYARPAVLEV